MEEQFIEFSGAKLPIRIISEKRRNSRVSVSRKGIAIRLPHFLGSKDRERQVSEFIKWAIRRLEKNPAKFLPEKPVEYYNGQEIMLMGMPFILSIEEKDVSRGFSKIDGNRIFISVPKNSESRNKIISASIKKVAGKFLDNIERRARHVNETYFRKNLGNIKIRNNKATWGSCSRSGEITISSRLLLAPLDIIDYVLVHEIAHLMERNHSKHFWKLVEKAVPGYREKRKWLRKNGDSLRF